MAEKHVRINGNTLEEREPLVATTGAGDAGRHIATDSTGKLDPSFLPTGIGADTVVVVASEALNANDLVNIYDAGSGSFRCRKADATTAGKQAHGFVKASVLNAGNATIYRRGSSDGRTGLAPGNYFLSTTPGGITQTAPSAAGNVWQKVGVGASGTVLEFSAGEPITRA